MKKTNSPEDADLIIQKLSSDTGIRRNPRKGTLNAPEKILDDFEFTEVVMLDEVFPDEFDLEETQRRIRENSSELSEYGKPILSIGGDHSVSYPVIKALKEKHPDLNLVWLDAHLDLKEKVGDHVSHDVVVRQLLEEDFSEDEIWIVGYSRTDGDEEEFLEGRDINLYAHDELEKFQREFDAGEQPVYLSVDIDVLKPELAPGTGYPDGELSIDEVKNVMRSVRPDFADLVEVAPTLDQDGSTLSNSREIVGTLMKQF